MKMLLIVRACTTLVLNLILVSFVVATPPAVHAAEPLSGSVTSVELDAPKPADQSTEPNRKPCLWKATRGNTTIYVFPTINHGKNRYFALTGEVAKYFKESRALAVDSHRGLSGDPYTLGCYKSPDKLSDHISPETKDALDELAALTGDSIDIYDVWKPFFLCTSFDSSLIRQIGFNVLDMERQLITEAKRNGKPVLELEPASTRLEYFEALPKDIQDLSVRYSLYDILDFQKQEVEVEDAWRSGNQEKLTEAVMRTATEHPECLPAFEALYQESNILMISTLDDVAKRINPIFVSLDVRRVVGRMGVLAVLAAEGFKVEQVAGLPPVAEPGMVTELPYVDSDDGSIVKELTPYEQAIEHYRGKRYKQALDILSNQRSDERCRYLAGLCYLGLDRASLAAVEFRWVVQNGRDNKIRENAEIALRHLR